MPVLPAPLLRALSLVPLIQLLSMLVVAAGPAPTAPGARWGWPLDPAPSVVRRFDAPADPWGSGHRGVDLAAAAGQQVRAPEAGTVSFAGVVAGRPVVVVTHSDGLRSTFEPVLPTSAVGTTVAAGAVVGAVASTPGHCAPETCVHWGVLRGDAYLDPLSFIAPRRVVLLPLTVARMIRGPPIATPHVDPTARQRESPRARRRDGSWRQRTLVGVVTGGGAGCEPGRRRV